MLSRFFIDRPIFAWVIAIVIMLAGALSITRLPVAQYPSVALPQISIQGFYPGASAQTVENSVTKVIEQKMKGLDHLVYMNGTSDSAGHATVTLTFEGGTNIDIAQVQAQNKLQSALAQLPQEVQAQGLTVVKSARNFLMVIGFYSEDGSYSSGDIGDYIASNFLDPMSRVQGIGDVQLFGSQYAMRIWLNPTKLASYSLTPADVVAAIRAQNAQVSAGQIGGTPAVPGATLNATVTAQSRLQNVADFERIIIKNTADGRLVRLRDVARMELGSESYDSISRLNGKPAGGMALRLAPGANALDTNKRVTDKLEEFAKTLPPGIKYIKAFDTVPFVEKSIQEVVKTLIEAIVLVFLVMFLFLQNWRATIIPTIAVPVVLLGTFAILAAAGYSINTLTMFGLVLAIGLLVDDAIVVVENVQRIMEEEGLSPVEATRKSMSEITGALVGIALVLAAVFVPMAFFTGSQGVIYRQFSVTLVSAMGLSVFVALVLTPALCATLLRPSPQKHIVARIEAKEPEHTTPRDKVRRSIIHFFDWFNENFDEASERYQASVRRILTKGRRTMIIYGLIVLVMAVMFIRLPTGFLPEEDQGGLFTVVQLPPGASIERTRKVMDQVSDHYLKDEKDAIEAVYAVSGFSFAGSGQNAGQAFVKMKDFEERHSSKLSAAAVAGRAMAAFSKIRDAVAFPIVPPAVSELGTSSGFDMQLQDIGGVGHDALVAARNQLLGMAAQSKIVAGVRPNGLDDTPQLKVDVDQAKAGAMGLSLADVNSTLSAALGGAYVNDFIDRGRVKKVYIQGDAPYRMHQEDFGEWYVRNAQGEMTPLSAIATIRWTLGSPRLERYNGLSSLNIQGSAGRGKSTGEAMTEMEKLAAKLPAGIGYEWTGISLQERSSGAQAPALYALSILVVFLLLAALYESWTIPLAVIMVIPLGVIGALLATTLRGLTNDIYFQVGLLTTMGLAAKNAILIIEFAKDLQERGRTPAEAALEAVRIRLRPILMTSLAFVFGVLPLAISSGAGSGSQHSIGTGVIGGMISATILGLLFVPLFFVVIQRAFAPKPKPQPELDPKEAT